MSVVSSAFLRGCLQGIETKGYDIRSILAAADIPLSCYRQPWSAVGGAQLSKLYLVIDEMICDGFIGCTTSERLKSELFSKILVKLFTQCRLLQDVVNEWQTFVNLVQNSGFIEVVCDRDSLIWKFTFRKGQEGVGSHMWMVAVTLLKLRLFSWMIGKKIQLNRMGFSASPPAFADELARLLKCPLAFNQPFNYFHCNRACLDFPIIRSREEILNYQNRLAADYFDIQGEDKYFTLRVMTLMREAQAAELRIPGIELVAEALGLSTRSLHRKLKEEGENFQRVKNQVRYNLAAEKLLGTDLSIMTIAMELGFSETTAFWRAFKSWTGASPIDYRSGKNRPLG